MLSGRSLIEIKNSIGPNTEPWGTSDNTGTGSELTLSRTHFYVQEHLINHLVAMGTSQIKQYAKISCGLLEDYCRNIFVQDLSNYSQ